MDTPTIPSLGIHLQTLVHDGVGKLGGVKPDASGVFRKFPLALLGVPSHNDQMYDPVSGIRAMNDRTKAFANGVEKGGREGEWGHPVIFQGYQNKDLLMEAMNRMVTIDRTKVSHRILSLDSEPMGNGAVLISGDVKPSGPYADLFLKEMADPQLNLGMSLRAYIVPFKNNPKLLEILSMITYDAIALPGFDQASKRAMVATESGYHVTVDGIVPVAIGDVLHNVTMRQQFATEEVTDNELLDRLGVNRLAVCNEYVGVYDAQQHQVIRGKQEAVSPFHLLFGKALDHQRMVRR